MDQVKLVWSGPFNLNEETNEDFYGNLGYMLLLMIQVLYTLEKLMALSFQKQGTVKTNG